MLSDSLANGPRHPLRGLREAGNITAKELSNLTGLSCSRISLCENYLENFTPAEEKKLKSAIVSLTDHRRKLVKDQIEFEESRGRR